MRTFLRRLAIVMVLLFPLAATAQEASLDQVAKAMGAAAVKSIQYTGSGLNFQVGQNYSPDLPWPRFIVKSYTRAVNYETATLRDELVRLQGEDPPRGGGGQPVRGEQRQTFVLNGDFAWTVTGEVVNPTPVALINKATVQGRAISFAVPGKYKVKATVDAQSMIERIDAVAPHAVLGDIPVEIRYSDYKDFGGVKFPTKIKQTIGAYPALELTVSDVQPNVAVDLPVPDPIRQTPAPYARVTSQMVAEGVWFLSGGSHNSALIEMKDHLILVESPLNEDRAAAVLAEVKSLVPSKPIRYLVNSHHHFDHAGGVRAVAGEGVTVITHEVNRAFLERAVAARATVRPDHLAKAGRSAKVEGVRDQRVLTDGTRTVEIRHIAGNLHHDGLIMVYLPKEKILIEADAYTPLPPNATPPTAANANPYTVNLADNLKKQNLNVAQVLPLHGRIVPVAEVH